MERMVEKRSEPRERLDEYYSVEISVQGIAYNYQFRIWNRSSKGLCVVVREDSALLKHLNVGDVLDMKYYSMDASQPTEFLKTEVRHITKDSGPFKGHYLVGISIAPPDNPAVPIH